MQAGAWVFEGDAFDRQTRWLREHAQEQGMDERRFVAALEFPTRLGEFAFELTAYFPAGHALSPSLVRTSEKATEWKPLAEAIASEGGLPLVAPTAHLFGRRTERFEELWAGGVAGAVIYRQGYTLEQTDFLNEQTTGRGMLLSGGSAGVARVGRFGVAFEHFSLILNRLLSQQGPDAEWVTSEQVDAIRTA